MNTKIKMCSMLLGLALFAACSSDDDVATPQPKTYPLTIEVSENPLIPEGGAANAAATRAAITTISSLNSFKMTYVYDNIPASEPSTANKNGSGKWTCSENWPSDAIGGDASDDKEVTWYAYTNGTFNLNDGNPYISFTGEEYANAQHDLLVAKKTDIYHNSSGNGHLFFAFDHVCTALRFYVKKATNLNDYTLSISKIKLRHVVKHGKYYYNSGAWTLTNSEAADFTDYTLYEGDALSLGSTEYEPIYGPYNDKDTEPYLFLIPQTLTAWNPSEALSNTYLEISCVLKNGDFTFSGTAYIPFAATLAKGIQRDVKINIGKNSLYSGTNTKIIN